MPARTATATHRLTRRAALFEAADPPRASHILFPDPDHPPAGPGHHDQRPLALPTPHGVTVEPHPVLRLPLIEALPVLLHATTTPTPHRATAFWGAAAQEALHLVARRRILPGLSPTGVDAWRVGPLETTDADRLHALAAAMPPEARALPLPDTDPPLLPAAHPLLRAFLDAVADTLPRTTTATTPFAAPAATPIPHLADWAREVTAGLEGGVRLSLRVETTDANPGDGAFHAVLQLHSRANPALIADARDVFSGAAGGFDTQAPTDAAVALRRAAPAWPPLHRLLEDAVPDALELSDTEVSALLGEAGARLTAAGVDVHWPRALHGELTTHAALGARDTAPHDLRSFLGGDHPLTLDWRIALDGQELTDEEIDHLAQTHRPVVRLRDQWVLVDPATARKALEREHKPLGPLDALGAALTGTVEVDGQRAPVAPNRWLAELRDRLAATPDTEPIPAPAALHATLRDYQLAGLRWLHRLTSLGLGGCLADDMGLGKTITVIALHLHRAATGPTLVVCPASLLGNWEREIHRFAPGTPVHRFHGPDRSLTSPTAPPTTAGTGFVLTTYPTMRVDAARLAAVGWGLLVADEAQHVKNAASATARALRRIDADARVALTGTPVENNLSELWAILDWATPGLLGPLGQFRTRWATPIEADGDTATAERLSRLLTPFLLRRRKSDPGIAPELPPKTTTDHPVGLTTEQASLYEAVVRETMTAIATANGMARRGLVMKLITALKQICNHPAQYLKEEHPRIAGRSTKLELLDELLTTTLAEDGAALVFTQYVAMARLIQTHLTERGVTTRLLHGGTPVAEREAMVRAFQDGEVPVLLLSLRAAGTGLNLTSADHVIHVDRWWNPAVEDQATDRAHRIGQTRPVQVHRLIAEGTIEDRIAAMLHAKHQLAESVLAGGEAALSELSDAELADLVELRRTP